MATSHVYFHTSILERSLKKHTCTREPPSKANNRTIYRLFHIQSGRIGFLGFHLGDLVTVPGDTYQRCGGGLVQLRPKPVSTGEDSFGAVRQFFALLQGNVEPALNKPTAGGTATALTHTLFTRCLHATSNFLYWPEIFFFLFCSPHQLREVENVPYERWEKKTGLVSRCR